MEAVDTSTLDPLIAEICEMSQGLRPAIDAFNAKMTEFYDAGTKIADAIEFATFEPPRPMLPTDDRPAPWVSTDTDPVQFVDRLKERRVSTTTTKAKADNDDDDDD